MAIRIGKVEELFELQVGLIVVTDTTYEQLAAELAVTIGSSVDFCDAGQVYLVAEVKGIEHISPFT